MGKLQKKKIKNILFAPAEAELEAEVKHKVSEAPGVTSLCSPLPKYTGTDGL